MCIVFIYWWILINFLTTIVGGLGGRAIYLDADGGFCAERMNQIAEATRSGALKQMDSLGTKNRLDIVLKR